VLVGMEIVWVMVVVGEVELLLLWKRLDLRRGLRYGFFDLVGMVVCSYLDEESFSLLLLPDNAAATPPPTAPPTTNAVVIPTSRPNTNGDRPQGFLFACFFAEVVSSGNPLCGYNCC
jgi:hypothetical protein